MASLSHNPSKKALRSPRSPRERDRNNGRDRDGDSGPQNTRNIKFARRTSSGRYVSLSRDDLDMSGELSGDYMNYTVHIPPTPDNQPMESSVATKAEEQYVSNSLFTGGFNSVTRAHLMDKVIESEVNHPQMAGSKGSACAMSACDGKAMRDERGQDVAPCECRFKICRDCFMDAQKGTGLCPGCKEPYKLGDYDDEVPEFSNGALPLPAPGMSVMNNNNKSLAMRNQNGEFDHNRWLFETQGTYGYGNAYWPKDDMYGDDPDDGLRGGMAETLDKPWKPLSRRIPIPAAVISPYRLLVLIRFIGLGFFLTWRVRHQNSDAIWAVGNVHCVVLRDKFDMPSPSNPTGRSDLPGVDLFVSTADPEKNPHWSQPTHNTFNLSC
ncbi:hypothetical protein IFM89_025840 [Coptis chinensis]|uniref:Cellulose synthase-like protein D3 n=1 Tax=Coptis chinensis TaxID=261450 RepID=A0A835HS60_9MAGN|nr:hypothetical protein IFM89_025840 [Coptis chinensis]